MTLTVELFSSSDPSKRNLIVKPLLEITYADKDTNALSNTTLSFSMDYEQKSQSFYKTTLILFIIVQVFCVIEILVRMCIFIQMNPRDHMQGKHCGTLFFRFVMVATDVWSKYNLYLVMFLTSILFFAYKMATEVTMLLPAENSKHDSSDLYHTFKVLFFAVLVTKTISMLCKIINQATADIFIMDWEKFRQPEYSPL